MALVVADRVQETSITSGTGTLTLAGALAGYQTFSTAIGNGNTTFYTIYDANLYDWEVGIGTVGAGTLARTTILSNSAGTTSPISFASNSKFVFCTYPAEKSINYDANGVATIGDVLNYADTGIVGSFASTVAGYNQVIVQNKSTATNASSNLNVSNDAGTAGSNYAELGINSSTFTGTGSFNIAGASYVASASTDLTIGTYGAYSIHFVTNSNTTDAMTIYNNGGVSLGAFGNPGINNIAASKFVPGYTGVTSAAGTTVLTADSNYYQNLLGSTTQTFQLPDATTLLVGTTFIFDNNSSGNLTVVDNASGPIETIPGGAAGFAYLYNNSTVAGSWNRHSFLPATYDFNATTANFGNATITNALWNGTTIATGYGGTGLTSFAAANNALYSTSSSALVAGTLPIAAGGTAATTFTANGVLYGNGTSALGVTAAGTTGQVLLANTSGAPTWGSVPSTGAVTSFQTSLSGLTPSTATTGDVTLAGTLGVTSGGTGTSTAFTTGSVVFAGASGTYTQDNANFFWDDTNNYLGIGTAAPATPLNVVANTSVDAVRITQTGSGNSFVVEDSTNPDATPFVINASGNVGIGISSLPTGPRLTVSGISGSAGFDGIRILGNNTNANTSIYEAYGRRPDANALSSFSGGILLSRTNTAPAALTTGMGVGRVAFGGSYDGTTTNIVYGAQIIGVTEGTYSSTSAPTGIVFMTTASGSAGYPSTVNTEVGTERMRIDSSGNVGIGVTPSAWGSNFKVIESAGNASAVYAGANVNGLRLTSNLYNDNTNFIYKTTGEAAVYSINTSIHQWFTAPSGTAGTTATLTERMRIDGSGNVSIGTTSSGTNGKLYVYETTFARLYLTDSTLGTDYGGQVRGWGVTGQGGQVSLGAIDANVYNEGIRVTNQATRVQFYTTSGVNGTTTERMRIHSSGGVSINNTTDPGAGNLTVTGKISDSKGDVRAAPIQSKASAYVLVATDAGQTISITTGGVTVNASIFSAGDMVSIFNNSGSSQTITQGTSVTLRLSGTATTGNRTLAQYGIATLLCIVGGATPTFVISGAGLT